MFVLPPARPPALPPLYSRCHFDGVLSFPPCLPIIFSFHYYDCTFLWYFVFSLSPRLPYNASALLLAVSLSTLGASETHHDNYLILNLGPVKLAWKFPVRWQWWDLSVCLYPQTFSNCLLELLVHSYTFSDFLHYLIWQLYLLICLAASNLSMITFFTFTQFCCLSNSLH